MLKNRFFTIIICIFTILFTITFSIALPICFRPFYYYHIEKYNLEEYTGKSESQIKEAYDEVLDYLTIPGKDFGTGDFEYTPDGESHFADCKILFILNFSVLLLSLSVVLILIILNRKKLIEFTKPFGLNVCFTSGISTLLLFVIIGGLAAIDFDKAFVIFHKIFFFGKDNWMFDSSENEIINALPQEFFLNCAILIVSSILLISVGMITYAIISKKLKK